jgi:hypothetical protein
MVRRSDHSSLENSLLDRAGRRSAGLTIDDVAIAVGDALRSQRRDILGHVSRLFKLAELRPSARQDGTRFRNLHARLTAVESELRLLKKGMLR